MAELNYVVDTVCPIVGVALSSIQFSSSIKLTLEARRLQDMGSINPTPLAVTFVLCVTRTIYGCLVPNPYYVLSVLCGLPISLFACSTALALLGKQNRQNAARNMEKILVPSLFAITMLGMLSAAGVLDYYTARNIFGFLSMGSTMVFFMAPLSRILSIVRYQDASSLYVPTIMVSVINTFVWSVYTVARWDLFVFIPSVVGLSLSLSQLSVKVYYDGFLSSPKPRKTPVSGGSAAGDYALGDHTPRSRRVSIDSGQVGVPAETRQYLELSSHDSPDWSTNGGAETDDQRSQYSHATSETPHRGVVASPRAALSADVELGVSEQVAPISEPGALLVVISDILEPFNPSLSKEAILSTEVNTPSLVHYRDEPVTFSGIAYDIAASIPAIIQSHIHPKNTELATRVRSSSYGMARYVDPEARAPAPVDIEAPVVVVEVVAAATDGSSTVEADACDGGGDGGDSSAPDSSSPEKQTARLVIQIPRNTDIVEGNEQC